MLKHSEPPRTYRKHTTTELARCVGCFCTTSGWFKHSEPTRTTPSQRGVGCLSTSSGWFTHSEPQRTYTNHTSTEKARCVGCFCTRSGWFKHIEPQRSYTLHTITELARCVGCFCTRSGWFKHLEPQRTYTKHTSTERASCLGCFCTSAGGSSTANLHEPHHHRASKVCRVFLHEFGVVQAQRTNTNHTITELARCVGCFCTRAGWFKHSEPPRTSRNSPAQS